MADDMNLPPAPEGGKKQNAVPSFPDFSPISKNSFLKAPSSRQGEKGLADKPVTTRSGLHKKKLGINEIKEKLQRELRKPGVKFDVQKQELKKEIDSYRRKLKKEKEQWDKIVAEKKNEVRRIKDALNGKDQLVNDKIIEVETKLKSKMNRERSRLAMEKKSLERKNNELESRLKEIESGWKKKEQEIGCLQKKALNELKGAEEKLQEEREKTWQRALKAKEDEINSLKVEITLQESRIRAVLEKKREEVKDIEEKTGKTIRDKTEQIVKEKENSFGRERDKLLEFLNAKDGEIKAINAELKTVLKNREKEFKMLRKEISEEQVQTLCKLEEDRAADFRREQERLKNLECIITEKDNEKRRLETEINIKNGVIFEKEEKLRKFEISMRRLEYDKQLLSEDLARSRAEVNRVKERSLYEVSGFKEDNEKLQKTLAEKNTAIESLRSTLARLNEESAKVEREYNLETSGKASLISELERVKAELKVLKERGQSDNLASQMNDKDTIIRSLNDTISKIEKEKAAIKDLILEKSQAEETKDKELKDLMDMVSNLTEDKNKFEFKTKELEADRENALNELNAAQSELVRLRTEAESLKRSYEEQPEEINRIKNGIDANLSRLDEQNRYIEELKNEITAAGNNLKTAADEAAAAKEILKNKEIENQKLQVELGGLMTRSEELSKLAEEKDNQLSGITSDFNGKLEALAEALKAKEKDLETAKEKVVELEHRIKNDYKIKEEELKLAISRLQMQLKEITGRHETELKAEKQKLQAIQAEYALREAQWTSQKDKEKETRGRMADMEASYAKLKKDASDNAEKFTSELENAQSKISAFEARISESEEKMQKFDKENNILAEQLMKEKEEKEKLSKKYADMEVRLKDLRRKMGIKFILWLWYPNEPRD
ncbi:MAG: hypothetical protein V1752_07160 [Candidatus Firestonebacteria bacterium]